MVTQTAISPAATAPPERKSWLDKLKNGLRKTGASIATVFTGTQIDDALYEDLESALLMADTGIKATEHLLTDLKARVKASVRGSLQPSDGGGAKCSTWVAKPAKR